MVAPHRYDPRSNYFEKADCTEIIPGKLYLGDRRAASNFTLLNRLGITHILNAAKEVECHFPDAFTYMEIPVRDGDPEIAHYFKKSNTFIKTGKITFVHCAKGVSRSATIVIAYLMDSKKWDFAASLEFVQQLRPVVSPHVNFQLVLMNKDA